VVEEQCASLDELTFDCLSFLTQQLQQRQERLVVSRQPVLVLCACMTLDFCETVLNLNNLELAGLLLLL
jgi:hypothetical protein